MGEGARDGCGRQPLRSGRAGGFAVGPALATPQGLPTAPNMGGAEGDLQGAIIGRAFVDNRHPLGWGAGLQGRWRHRPPLLLHWNIRILGGYGEDGSKAEGFSPHRTDNQGGFPPYLRAAIVPGQGRAALPWDPPLPWLYGGGYHLGRRKQALSSRGNYHGSKL